MASLAVSSRLFLLSLLCAFVAPGPVAAQKDAYCSALELLAGL